MAEMDLATALNMFKEGAQSLSLSRAVNNANDQVNQIRASEGSEADKRSQLQQLSNGLVMHMAAMGAPATTMQAVSGAIMPHFGNSAQMNQYGVETGDSSLQQQAAQQQQFEMNPEIQKYKAMMQAMMPFKIANFDEKQDEFNQKQFSQYSQDANMMKASSRSQFGQWAAVAGNGDRLQQILGQPSQWKNMTSEQLALVSEGLTKQVSSGVPTEAELKVLNPFMAKVAAARAQTAATGKPVSIDLSGYAGLYSGLASREDMTAKTHLMDNMMNLAQGRASLYGRNPEQWKQTTASNFSQIGLNINPDTIKVDPVTKRVTIPELQPMMDAANSVPKNVRQAYADASSGDGTKAAKAKAFLSSFGVTPGTAPSDAIRIIQAHIKSKAFE